ncbi:MAG: methyltransferase [Deltaproteobacteria bacterium]|nr:methyltransferase [Deltaproteobacteria bacterium]
MKSEETTLDSIRDIRLVQSKKGYRFSVAALLLENFISVKKGARLAEFGTGSGIVSLLLAKRLQEVTITAIEVQDSLAGYAEKNVKLNGLEDIIDVFTADIRKLKKRFQPHTFDAVFSNPPFRKLRSGLVSAEGERAIARHEIKISLPEIIRMASYLLKDMGRLYLLYHPFRMVEVITLLHGARLEPKRIRFVHSRRGEEAKMVLIEAVKGSRLWLNVDPPLFIHAQGSTYTEEMKKVLGKNV